MGRRLTDIVLFILCSASSLVVNPSSITTDAKEMCGPQMYYDKQRMVCLDLCGRYGTTRCPIERFCSTRVSWGDRINPPRCLPHCFRRCDGPLYCDHDAHDCLPCDSLCSRLDVTQCRKYCYDVYVLLTTTSQTTTAGRDHTTVVALNEGVRSTNHSWKTIAVVISCVSAVLLFGFIGIIICYCQKSASTAVAGGEGDKRLLSTEKQGEPDTPNMDRTIVNLV